MTAVGRALDFLAGEQLESGQFRMEYTLLEERDPRTGLPVARPEKSPFCSSYVAHSLSCCDDPRVGAMIQRVVDFLQHEQVKGGLWRYWCKDAQLHHQIPPDVDDTACISELLRRLGGGAPDNEGLLLANLSSDDLFYTWIIPRLNAHGTVRWWRTVLGDITYGRVVTFWRAGASRNDIDSVVNANVLLYLGERSETEPVIRWLLEISRTGREESTDKWYRSGPAFYYALSRCYARGIDRMEQARAPLERCFSTISHADGRIGENALQTAMAVCALMNFGYPHDAYGSSLDFLLAAQEDDGGWGSFPIYYDGRSVPQIWWGSRAVTTGFCVEALARVPVAGRV